MARLINADGAQFVSELEIAQTRADAMAKSKASRRVQQTCPVHRLSHHGLTHAAFDVAEPNVDDA